MGPCVRRDDTEIVVAPRRSQGRRMTAPLAGQTVETARRALTARFRTHAIDSAELDARIFVGTALGLDLTGLIAAASRLFTQTQRARLAGAVPRPVDRVPRP